MSTLRALTMPKWGIEMTEGTLAEWQVSEGADFARGDVLTAIETDKIANEVEAEAAGRLARIVAPAGSKLPVGALLAVLADADTSPDQGAIDAFVTDYRPAGAASEAPPLAPARAPPPIQSSIPQNLAISPAARDAATRQQIDLSGLLGSGRVGRVTLQDVIQAGRPITTLPPADPLDISVSPEESNAFASPLAVRIAEKHGIDLRGIAGTGARGRIGKADVIARLPAPEVAPAPLKQDGVTIVPMSPMRKAIARQLSLSKATIPHFQVRNSVCLDDLLRLKDATKEANGEAPSITDYMIRACALALSRFPEVNIQVHGDEIHRFAHADIAIAVATEKGLITPILRAAETKPVRTISAEANILAANARAGQLSPHEYQGGSFSISNLGMFNIDQFDAIINPPQGAILAVGAAREIDITRDGNAAKTTRIQLSASFDHRAIDGALGAQFLAEVTRLLEHPLELII